MESQIIKLIKNKKFFNNFNHKINLKNKILFSKKNGTYSKNKILNFLNELGQN